MKYIPVKIVHYTELKQGDLVSTDHSCHWDPLYGVYRFEEIVGGCYYFTLEKQFDLSDLWEQNAKFPIDTNQNWLLLKKDGNGTGFEIPASKILNDEQPNSSQGITKLTETI